jgi:pimeloyl-ACP methyl ester carboxylesterase
MALALLYWHPLAGRVLYQQGGALEARLYGLKRASVDVADQHWVYYHNGLAAAQVPIVLLHGFTADKNVWPRFAKHLVDDYPLLIPDLPAYGESGMEPSASYAIPQQARRLLALLDALGIEQFHVMGNSMGGELGAYLAAAHPQRIRSVAMLDPGGLESPQPSELDQRAAKGANPFLVASPEQFQDFYALTMAQPPWLPPSILSALATDYMRRREDYARIFAELRERSSVRDVLGQIRAPSLLVWGAQDQLLDVSAVPVWEAAIADLQVEVWPGIGHMPMVEAPQKLAARYVHFLQQLAVGSL